MRGLAFVLTVAVAGSLPACGPDYQMSDDRRGEVNGRSFELVSTKADGNEWSFRVRGSSLWVGYVREDKIDDLGNIELSGKESKRLWDLIETVDVGGRKHGKADGRRGTITLRLREPDGEGGHDLTTVLVSRKTNDEDILNLADYFAELIKVHKHVEPSL